MKAAPFEYHAPQTLDEALALLAEFGDEAKVLAGGQSLVPILALRLSRFEHLIDLNRIPDVEYGHVVTPADTPGGFKGVGEGGAIGSPPAVVNAVADALAPLGARITGTPLGPAQVLAALTRPGSS